MKKYLIMEAMKFLNGTYATRVVAEFDASEQAHESNTNRNHYYKVYIISHPLLS